MKWIALTLAFLVASAVQAQFVVVNKMPHRAITVANHCGPVKTVVHAITHRAPIGHTHTCANGHTWDHSVTAGHNCPICGQAQYIQDRSPRMVTVVSSPSPARAAQPQYHEVMQLFQASGGCASGNCSNTRR